MDDVKEISVDVEEDDGEARELLLQHLSGGVELVIEMKGVTVDPFHALVTA